MGWWSRHFSIGSFSLGAIAWAIIKALYDKHQKRVDRKDGAQREAVKKEIAIALQLRSNCLDASIKYYTIPDSSDRSEVARILRHNLQLLGTHFNQVNKGLRGLGLVSIDGNLLIDFRKAMTLNLDISGMPAVPHDHPMIVGIYDAAEALLTALNDLQFKGAV